MVDIVHILASTTPLCGNSGSCGLPTAHANHDAIQNVLTIVFGLVGALSLLMITISGLRYITSAGNPEQASKAKDGVVYALVGLAIALTAEAIVTFVVKNL